MTLVISGLGRFGPVTGRERERERERENREMGGSGGLEAWEGGSETWIVCQQRLGSAWAGDVEAGGDVEHGETKRESD